jgi:dienelactone hydrolase
VISVQGNGQPVADQAILAEFLASHGFVVATSPSVTRRRGPPPSADSIGPSAERQADDVARVVRRVSQRYGVDPRRVGLIGHSFGARGALLFQMRGRAVRALVSLDGGIGTATGTASMLTAPSYSSTRGGVPVLHFFETLSAAMAPDWVFLRTLRGPVTVAKVEGMRHHHFTDLGGLVGQLPALARATQATSGTAAGYRAVAEATLTFLERRLRRSPGGAMGVSVSVDSLLTMTPLSQVDR